MLPEDGERFLPWMSDPIIAYEHWHRYRWAGDWSHGKMVLDIGSGEGYGSALMAEGASSVVGVDVDPRAIRHGAATYRRSNLHFVVGSASHLPFANHTFDLIVCFEMLEHLPENEQGDLITDVQRVLKPDGVCLVSTPNVDVYSDEAQFHNPFHLHELSYPEFQGLMNSRFNHTMYFGQRVFPMSSLWNFSEGRGGGKEYVMVKGDSQFFFCRPDEKRARYVVCAASPVPFRDPVPGESLLLDASEQVFHVQRRAEGAVVEMQHHLRLRHDQVVSLEGELEERTRWVQTLAGELEERTKWATSLAGELAQSQEQIQVFTQRHVVLTADLQAIRLSLGWHLLERCRSGVRILFPMGTWRGRLWAHLRAAMGRFLR